MQNKKLVCSRSNLINIMPLRRINMKRRVNTRSLIRWIRRTRINQNIKSELMQ